MHTFALVQQGSRFFRTGIACASLIGTALSGAPSIGRIYTETNALDGNEIRSFVRLENGSLSTTAPVPTGGRGTGAGLGSQGSVTLSKDGHWLFAVDAGSDDIAVFQVVDGNLTLTDRHRTNGTMPISVTVSGSLVYVLNA